MTGILVCTILYSTSDGFPYGKILHSFHYPFILLQSGMLPEDNKLPSIFNIDHDSGPGLARPKTARTLSAKGLFGYTITRYLGFQYLHSTYLLMTTIASISEL